MQLILILVAGSVASSFASNDWCFVSAAGAVGCLIADRIADAAIGWRRIHKSSTRCFARTALALGIGTACGWLLRISPTWAFHETFGVDVPPQVQVTRISRHYEGGPGEHTLILEFTASRSGIDALTSRYAVRTDSENIDRWRELGGDWEAAWTVFNGVNTFPYSHRTWRSIAPIESPIVYDFGLVEDLRGWVVLLWNTDSGRAVAVHRRP